MAEGKVVLDPVVGIESAQVGGYKAWLAILNYGERAALSLSAHPHMLRHVCSIALADQGADTRLVQDYIIFLKGGRTEICGGIQEGYFERYN